MTNSHQPEDTLPESDTLDIATPALLRSARGVYRNAIRTSLVKDGFEDLPRNGPFVLGAMARYGIPAGDVVHELRITKQAASQLIDSLVVRGYLERSPYPDDRRRMILKATERGRAAAASSRSGVESIDRKLAASHSPAEISAFKACLLTLAHLRGLEDQEQARETQQEAKTRFIRVAPIFAVKDLKRTLDHYRGLGFLVKAYEGGNEYGFAWRDGVEIHFTADVEFDQNRDAGQAYIHVEDADALASEWAGVGVGGKTRPVRTTEYLMREGSHIDPDNNEIRFGSDVELSEGP